MSMRRTLTLAAAAAVLFGGAAAANPAYDGVWIRPATGGKIQSFACGGGLGLKVVASKTPAFVGETIMCGAGQTGPNSYQGLLRHLEEGGTYTGKVEIRDDTMRLSGCVMNGLVCRAENWRRVK